MKTKKILKTIVRRLKKNCAICGKEIKIISYSDKTYRGGKYFFKVPISTKKEWKKALSFGTKTEKWGNMTVQVMKRDPKPYKLIEYWECPKCFYRK